MHAVIPRDLSGVSPPRKEGADRLRLLVAELYGTTAAGILGIRHRLKVIWVDAGGVEA
jgi:hypothetical protein